MDELQKALLEIYNNHYKRINGETDPIRNPKRGRSTKDSQYGPYVQNLDPGSKVLDLGCGTGFLLHWLTQFKDLKLFGVDASASQAEIAAESLPEVKIQCQDGLEYLRKQPNQFDIIFCTDLLEHLGSNEVCLEWLNAIYASLKPNGIFICRTPNGANLLGYCHMNLDATHQRSFTKFSLLQLFEACGFKQCEVKPTSSRTLLGKFRQVMEKYLHRFIYLVCGAKMNVPVSRNIVGIARKQMQATERAA